jgi:GTP-binding protein Era
MLKKIGTAARHDIEEFIDKKVFLELYVKVDEDWRDDERRLKSFGYLH